MITAVLFVILLIVLTAYLIEYAYEKPCENFPPGPPRIPFFGSYAYMLLQNYKWSARACAEWSKTYQSDVIGLWYGPFPLVVLNSIDSIKAFFNTPEMDGRLEIFPAKYRSPVGRLGLFFSDGPEWHVQKRFSLRSLRDFGFGRRSPGVESIIEQELKYLIGLIENGPNTEEEKTVVKEGGLIKLPWALSIPIIYPMLSIITNKAWTRDSDTSIRVASSETMYLQKCVDDLGGFLTISPYLRHIAPYLTGFDWLERGNSAVQNLAQSLIDDSERSKDPNNDYDRNFIDVYMTRMKAEVEQNADSHFSVPQLALMLNDYLFPTLTGISQHLTSLFKETVNNPELQYKCQREIDEVVGRGRLPNLSDRPNLPFNEACIREMTRRWTLVPFSIPHKAVKEFEFMGYTIPANCAIAPNIYKLHMDEELWGDPFNFRPERFLGDDGKLCLKKDFTLPFGAGRRLCAGETYARNMMFLTFTALMQNFNIQSPDGKTTYDIDEDIKPGIITWHEDCWMRIIPRKH